jgi:hypothetical protein
MLEASGYYRVLNLAEQGKTVKEAKKQAQKEILAVFGIDSDSFKDSEDMSIFGTSESDAALLAISVLLQSDLSEGDFSQRLADFGQAIKTGGSWDNEEAKKSMAEFARNARVGKNLYCMYENNPSNCWPMPTGDRCEWGILVKDCNDMGSRVGHMMAASVSTSEIAGNILGWDIGGSVPFLGIVLK